MNKLLALSILAGAIVTTTAAAQVPGLPAREAPNNETNSLSVQAQAPQALTPTPADTGIAQSRPAAAPAPAATASRATLAAPQPATSLADSVTRLDAQLLELAKLQQDTERSRAQLELLNAQEQIQEVSRRTTGTQMGLTEVPLLVGIMTDRGRLVAEFLANGAVLQASEGEMVSPEWQLEKIRQTSVEIKRRGRAERHILMFGGSAKAP